MEKDLFPQTRQAVEELLSHKRYTDKVTANGTRFVARSVHEKALHLGTTVHRAYGREMLPTLLSCGEFVKNKGPVASGSPIIPLVWSLRGGCGKPTGGKEWQSDIDTLLDHVTAFRRGSGQVSWDNSVLISHPYHLPDHPIVLPPHIETLGLGIWARKDLSSWHSRTALVIIAKGLPSGSAADFGFIDLTKGILGCGNSVDGVDGVDSLKPGFAQKKILSAHSSLV
jgi:hypothetical protein